MESKDLIEIVVKNSTWIIISWIGGMAHYLYKISRGEVFKISRFIINIVLAWWIGYLWQKAWLGEVFISIAWFCTYPILWLIEYKGAKIILELLTKK